jgi:RNA-splicing ligase RtcB
MISSYWETKRRRKDSAMEWFSPKVAAWPVEFDEQTKAQAHRLARLPIVPSHLALMPDAHLGKGATIGSVLPTLGAVVPAAVGVDLGCGMIAVRTDLLAKHLPDNLNCMVDAFADTCPAGVGVGHVEATKASHRWHDTHGMPAALSTNQKVKSLKQFGTLGSGNHFAELCLDDYSTRFPGEADRVWVVLHSGSRGIGNELASGHIRDAKRDFVDLVTGYRLEEQDQAWLQEGTPGFDAYIADMLWAQGYALGSREAMMDAALKRIFAIVGKGREVQRINCHHNFCQQETHVIDGVEKSVWLTRKGAIKAGVGDLGVIPGSMGAATHIVEGLGNPLSYNSCSHGAGRRMSRSAAKRQYTVADLKRQMKGRAWLDDHAAALIDEIPSSYKNIDEVMEAQTDLVKTQVILRQVANFKGQ